MKHAYCIIAHSDPYCLQKLLSAIDDERNDIYLLIDKKTSPELERNLKTERSRLNIVPADKRIDIRWGGISQIKAELLLFETALQNSEYGYLHLLSGADLLLKSQNYIHSFFDSLPENTNVVAFSHGEAIKRNVDFKTRFYHPFIENQRLRKDGNPMHTIFDYTAKIIRQIAIQGQKIMGYRRNWGELKIKKGSQWVSITTEFAKYLTERKEYILNKFKGVICADEIFIQTLLYNSSFIDTIWDYKKEKEPIRLIDWERGEPYIWHKEDLKELQESNALFARKFSSQTDREIIDLISEDIVRKNSMERNSVSCSCF